MSEYKYIQADTNFYVQKNNEIYISGKFIFSLGSYCFEFSDNAENHYLMKSSGFFFWRKLVLYLNGDEKEYFSIKKAKNSDVSFDNRSFIKKQGCYVHHIDIKKSKHELGKCLYAWSGTPLEIEIQVICLVILRVISSRQKVYSSAHVSA